MSLREEKLASYYFQRLRASSIPCPFLIPYTYHSNSTICFTIYKAFATALIHLNLKITSWGQYDGYSHFTDKKTDSEGLISSHRGTLSNLKARAFPLDGAAPYIPMFIIRPLAIGSMLESQSRPTIDALQTSGFISFQSQRGIILLVTHCY